MSLPPLFSLGKVVATPGALRFCEEHHIDPLLLISRHVRGDFGDMDEEDIRANSMAVYEGTRIFSAYAFPQGRLYVITEADRSSTCVLLPEEY